MTAVTKELTLREVRAKTTTVSKIVQPLSRTERKELLNERTTMSYYLYARGIHKKKGTFRTRDYSDAYMKVIQGLDAADEEFVINLTEGRANQQMWNVEFLEEYYEEVSKMLARKAMEKAGMSEEQISLMSQ